MSQAAATAYPTHNKERQTNQIQAALSSCASNFRCNNDNKTFTHDSIKDCASSHKAHAC